MKTAGRKLRHSLSGKLLLLFVAMAVVFVLLVGGGIRHVFQQHFRDNIQPHLAQYLEYVQRDIGMPPDRVRAKKLAERLNIKIQIHDAQGDWSSSGRVADLESMEIEPNVLAQGTPFFHAKDADRHYLMVRDGDATLLFNVTNMRGQREGLSGLIPLLILLLVLLVLYHATRRLIAPIDTIKQGAFKFGEGDLSHRIDVARRDELGDLAAGFNEMAAEIRQMLDAKRQLLLAISHELRSPLTRARVAAEMLDDHSAKEQIIRDINEMESLIEELIEAERLSDRHRKLHTSRHDLVQLVCEVVQTRVAQAGVHIALPDVPCVFEFDAARIKLLVTNLLQNAIRHTPEIAQTPEVRLSLEGANAVLQVADHGAGIDAHHLPHLSKPFYRIDPSRQRETGGYGLGLYLCRMIAEAHGGELKIDSTPGAGTCVTVRLPRGGDSPQAA